MNNYGIVEIFPLDNKEKNRCGYCKNKRGSISYGMWGHRLTVENYQDLTERGWRRSGKYCYKPVMKETCCPQYTIKCDVPYFQLSKSQKSILRRMKQFLMTGNTKAISQAADNSKVNNTNETHTNEVEEKFDISPMVTDALAINPSDLSSLVNDVNCKNEEINKSQKLNNVKGADPTKPLCKKAKIIRMERKQDKLAKQLKQFPNTSSLVTSKTQGKNVSKSLRDHLNEPLPPNSKHTLKVLTVRPNRFDKQFLKSFEEVYALYKKYQVSVHNDSDCSSAQFRRFLVDSPLMNDNDDDDLHGNFGSFHQQYWLDDKLIAVGVIDILPKYVSSVYFFYDPDYSFLSLGNYGALREIAFTETLHEENPDLRYYLMGFYIHSCIKMRYKGQYKPSFLLCPETFTWQPIENATKKLDVAKYSRLEDDPTKVDEGQRVRDDEIMIYYERNVITYKDYLTVKENISESEKRNIHHYAKLVGKKSIRKILLYRS